MLRLEPRSSHSVLAAWLAPLVALVMTFITGGLIFMAMGEDPAATLYIYFLQPLVSASGLSEVAVKAAASGRALRDADACVRLRRV